MSARRRGRAPSAIIPERVPAWGRQSDFAVRFDWGPTAVQSLAGEGAVVIVDVLRFTTAVEAAGSRLARVYPYRWRDESAARFAESVGARLADHADRNGPSLSPLSLLELSADEAVVLPSPNGSACSALAAETGVTVLAACVRNARAVGESLRENHTDIAVIACGERWPDGSLRPALEDFLGAGAVLAHVGGHQSPEARAAVAAWRDSVDRIEESLFASASGTELVETGWGDDVVYAAVPFVSDVVPVLRDGAFEAYPTP